MTNPIVVSLDEKEKEWIADPEGADCGCCDCPVCHLSWEAVEQVIAHRVEVASRLVWDTAEEALMPYIVDEYGDRPVNPYPPIPDDDPFPWLRY